MQDRYGLNVYLPTKMQVKSFHVCINYLVLLVPKTAKLFSTQSHSPMAELTSDIAFTKYFEWAMRHLLYNNIEENWPCYHKTNCINLGLTKLPTLFQAGHPQPGLAYVITFVVPDSTSECSSTEGWKQLDTPAIQHWIRYNCWQEELLVLT